MQNVREWLESIGLQQYADAFEANDVDADVLPQLNHELLQQIGVRSVGHRVKIVTALKSLGERSPTRDSIETAATRSSANATPPPRRNAAS